MADLDAVLPLPTGDPQALLTLARTLAYVADHGTQTVLAQHGGNGLGLETAWSGAASEAATAEARGGAQLAHQLCEGFTPVVAACNQYAGALTDARRTVESLREQWRAADRLLADTVQQPLPADADPAMGLALTQAANAHLERSRAELLARHTACVQELRASGDQAAAAVSGAPGGVDLSGIGDSPPLATLLPLTYGAQQRGVAMDLVERACQPLGTSDPTSWTRADLERVLGTLADRVDDPMVAQALMTRLGPEGVEHAARVLDVAPGTARGAQFHPEALALLGLAFATSVSDRVSAPSDHGESRQDPVNRTVLDEWRPGWVQQLLDRPVASVTTQLGLVAAAATSPSRVLPGYAYAVQATRTLLARADPRAERLDWQTTTRDGGRTIAFGVKPDPFQLLFTALAGDPRLASDVLLSPGLHEGQTVLHELVVDRPLAASDTRPPLRSSAALGELMTKVNPGPGEPLATAFLDAVGDAGIGWWQLKGQESINVDRHLDPFRQPAANLLSADPGVVWEAIDTGPLEQPRKGRMQGLLGEIAKNTTAEESTLAAPALAPVLVSLSLWEADQFGQAVASAAHTDATERAEHAELIRLGRVLGFATESGTVALTYAAGQLDARNVADRATLRQGFDLANQLPASLLPAGGVASILKSPIQEAILAIYGDAHRVDNAEHVAVARSSALEEARTLAEACASKQVQSHAAQAALRYDQAGHLLMSEELRNAVDTGSKMVSQTGPVPMAAP